MGIPLIQQYRVGRYLVEQRLKGNRRSPLVLMLEPLFQCNLACAGCGKIDYPSPVLRQRLSVDAALAAVDECGAPVVSIAGGEPLLHRELPGIVDGIVARRKFVYLCTNALLLEKRIGDYSPSRYLNFSIHLDGLRGRHDKAVCRTGVFDRAVSAVKLAVAGGFRTTVNCTLFNDEDPDQVAAFFDYVTSLGVEAITVSPGYRYESAPRQDIFPDRSESKRLFREIFARGGRRARRWRFNHSSLFLDFLAGNQSYQCTPWSNPTYNIFGWQKPCYLLSEEGYAASFEALLRDTDWESYGVGRNAKCRNCMAHCGFEGTAVADTVAHPLKALKSRLTGPRLDGGFAPDPGGRGVH